MNLRILSFAAALLASGSAYGQTPANVLVYGDSNSWGWVAQQNGFPTVRMELSKRWPDVMAARLGHQVVVSVDALSGRTVDVDYPEALGSVPGADFNGVRSLPAAIGRAMPLDLVVIMLGTNDVRSDLNRTPEQIAAGIRRLVELVRGSSGGVFTSYPAPRVLVVVPPHVEDTSKTPIDGVMAGAQQKSRALSEAVRGALAGTGTPVFDASVAVRIHGVDGVHLTVEDHQALGQAMAHEVSRVLGK
jgi:lysophospholipase L1-like esterase